MAKTQAPASVTVAGATFSTNAMPDVFDERDLVYRSTLALLPEWIDQRDMERRGEFVLKQRGNSCTGHAVAAMVDLIRTRAAVGRPAIELPQRVSPYMLYSLARRYDEFEGEEDLGSSLRGALKGWFNHGVCRSRTWRGLGSQVDLVDPDFVSECREVPLGAYYRVNTQRLDDMQSAVAELGVVVASAAVHEGWVSPEVLRRDDEELHVIARPVSPEALGGHAFAIVGYNRTGFLVQNSWGTSWGNKGYATLPYEDWLESAYDAWVARPGVPHTPFAAGMTRTAPATDGGLMFAAGPDLPRLRRHVVNLGNNGRLSSSGKFVSDGPQIASIFEHMKASHDHWLAGKPNARRQIVLYAHGGLNDEASGLEIAERQLNWWLNNRIYPISFAWQTGASESMLNQLGDLLGGIFPFGGIRDDLIEQWDRRCEKVAKTAIKWIWDEMKENARKASNASPATTPGTAPGATLIATLLKAYVQACAGKVDIHLVGHSAGCIFHSYLLERIRALNVPVKTISMLAPAVRTDVFQTVVTPHLATTACSVFGLSDKLERDDTASGYMKSLLYLVSRALEKRASGESEAPIVGMAKHVEGVRQTVEASGGEVVIAPDFSVQDGFMSNAKSHSGFDNDSLTMSSVARFILKSEPLPYAEAMPLDPVVVPAALPIPAPVGAVVANGDAAGDPRAAFGGPGDQTRAVARRRRQVPRAVHGTAHQIRVECAEAPMTGAAVVDILTFAEGWTVGAAKSDAAATKRRTATPARSRS